MQDHTQPEWHDNTAAYIDVQLNATNKQNNSTLPKDIGTLLFWRKFGIPGHTRPNPKILHDLTKAFIDI